MFKDFMFCVRQLQPISTKDMEQKLPHPQWLLGEAVACESQISARTEICRD